MELVKVEEKYYEFIRDLRSRPENSKWFLQQVEITPEQQVNYMKKYSSNYRVCLLYGEPVGYVGVIDQDIRICTHSDFLGKGVGSFMLSEIHKVFPGCIGKIMKNNVASINLFKKCNVPYELI